MKKKILIGLALILALSLVVACGSNQGNSIETEESEPPVPDLTEPPPVSSADRCALFEDMEMEVILYDIYPSSGSLTMYVGMVEIPGLENDLNGGSWEYTAKLGDSVGLCSNFPDDPQVAGRLFCSIPMFDGYKNTNKPFSLHVNGCDESIHEVPLLSLVTEPEPAVNASCGPAPTQCGPAFGDWCDCVNGIWNMCSVGILFCFH